MRHENDSGRSGAKARQRETTAAMKRGAEKKEERGIDVLEWFTLNGSILLSYKILLICIKFVC